MYNFVSIIVRVVNMCETLQFRFTVRNKYYNRTTISCKYHSRCIYRETKLPVAAWYILTVICDYYYVVYLQWSPTACMGIDAPDI